MKGFSSGKPNRRAPNEPDVDTAQALSTAIMKAGCVEKATKTQGAQAHVYC